MKRFMLLIPPYRFVLKRERKTADRPFPKQTSGAHNNWNECGILGFKCSNGHCMLVSHITCTAKTCTHTNTHTTTNIPVLCTLNFVRFASFMLAVALENV